MLEIKLTVELPGVSEAINHLADALLASKVPVITTSPAEVKALPVADTAPVQVEAAPVPEKKTRKRKEAAPVPVEKAEDAPPLAEVPAEQEPVVNAPAVDPEPAGEATPVAADPEPAVVEDIPQDDGPVYNIDMLSRAGTALLDQGKMGDLLNLLSKYGASSLMDLKPEQYGPFAQDLKAIGADLP